MSHTSFSFNTKTLTRIHNEVTQSKMYHSFYPSQSAPAGKHIASEMIAWYTWTKDSKERQFYQSSLHLDSENPQNILSAGGSIQSIRCLVVLDRFSFREEQLLNPEVIRMWCTPLQYSLFLTTSSVQAAGGGARLTLCSNMLAIAKIIPVCRTCISWGPPVI